MDKKKLNIISWTLGFGFTILFLFYFNRPGGVPWWLAFLYLIFCISIYIMGQRIKKQEEAKAAPKESPATVDKTDALLRLKQLLDEGFLTQEEFDAKKKELLNL